MQLIRAVFDCPKDISETTLNLEFHKAGNKFVDHFEAEGWVLRSPLDYYLDKGHSNKDPDRNHYVIVGYFHPLNKKPDPQEVIHLPKKVVDVLKQKMPEKVKVLNERD